MLSENDPGGLSKVEFMRYVSRGYAPQKRIEWKVLKRRSDFWLSINQSQWRDRAGFTPASLLQATYYTWRLAVLIRIEVRDQRIAEWQG